MSMLRNLATSLINAHDERIVTTLPKAKELRPFVERAITLSRHATNLEGEDREVRGVHLRRQAAGFFHAGNRQQKVSTGKRGQVVRPRTAGVLRSSGSSTSWASVSRIVRAAIRASSSWAVAMATTPSWRSLN